MGETREFLHHSSSSSLSKSCDSSMLTANQRYFKNRRLDVCVHLCSSHPATHKQRKAQEGRDFPTQGSEGSRPLCLSLSWGNLQHLPWNFLGKSTAEAGIHFCSHPSNSIWGAKSFLRGKQPIPAVTSHGTSCCPRGTHGSPGKKPSLGTCWRPGIYKPSPPRPRDGDPEQSL